MLQALLALMVSLAPEAPHDRLERVARAIIAAAHTREEAAVLVTIEYYETRFERAGIPFGLFSWRHRIVGEPLAVCAQSALRMFGYTQRCGDDVAVRLGWYHTGHCRADTFSTRESQTYHDVLHGIPRDAHSTTSSPAPVDSSSSPPSSERP